MALISNATFSLKTSDIVIATKMLRSNPDFFEKKNLENAMLDLCRGANYVPAVKAWMQSASLLGQGKHGSLTQYALEILDHDPEFTKANTWWAVHLLLCMSEETSPYPECFKILEPTSNKTLSRAEHESRVFELVKANELERNAKQIEAVVMSKPYSGVIGSFKFDPNLPLSQLGLFDMEIQKGGVGTIQNITRTLTKPSDATFLFALSLFKFKFFPTSVTIDFQKVDEVGLHYFLGCSKAWLSDKTKMLSSHITWGEYINYDPALNLNSLEIKASCIPKTMLKHMLEENVDGWM
ncbi:DUF4007 family protein [Shewanella sp. 5_MG-2023]|uniref:DUF4007 family protein n=1 Tax=Shewanella sp. 5_MG-2023 TaxID=3062656 RepID=UPI0026E22642|nr:DUF4007 family protein [Shewanella sp. 5_MG-2023]MDO6639758.1 DUF4007 family protein [Shewanella sp. 5_MG-2023]